jgi:putative sigma-54 modulation protein
MKIRIHSIHFVADRKLIGFLQQKINKLETFYRRVIGGEVFLRLNNEGIENKTVEIRLTVPGAQVFAKEQGRTFEAATQEAVDALRQQLIKTKTRVTRGRA